MNHKRVKGSSEQKRDLLKSILNYQVTIESDKATLGTSTDASTTKNMNPEDFIPYKVMTSKFKNVYNSTSFKNSVKGKNAIDSGKTFGDLQEKNKDLAAKKIEYQKNVEEIQTERKRLEAIRIDYMDKLASLKQNADIALAENNYNSEAAAEVIGVYQDEYVKNMKPSISKMKESLGKSVGEMDGSKLQSTAHKMKKTVSNS